MLYLEKNCKAILFRSLTQVSENMPKIISIRPRITEKLPFKKLKTLSFLAFFYFKNENSSHFQFYITLIYRQRCVFLKIWHIRVNYCWSYRPSNLLFRFFRCRLGHLDNRQEKIAENTKQRFVESFKVFDPPTTKWWSFKFFCEIERKPNFNG